MISSVQNINLNVFQIFLGNGGAGFLRNYVSITDTDGVEVLRCGFRYYRESSVNFSEANFESYPLISVQDFTPTPVKMWNDYPQKYYGGENFSSATDANAYAGTYEIPKPIRLSCKYTIAVAALKESDYTAIQSWFYTNFGFGVDNTIVFNRFSINGSPQQEFGDFANYTIEQIENTTREDGVFECIYRFEFHVWAELHAQKAVDRNTSVVLTIQEASL